MDERLLELIGNGATIQELRQDLGLNNYQLALKLNSLKNKGFLIEKTYNDGIGTIIFLHQNLGKNRTNNNIRIYTDGGKIRFLVIADTHFGNKNDRFDLVNKIYDYAVKNGIHSILHLGDLIEGHSFNFDNSDELKMTDAIETGEYIIKNYPKDNSIVNYILLGNHDFRTIATQGFDLSSLISNSRLDMEFLGYNNATIELHKDSIGLQHPASIKNHTVFDEEFDQYYEKMAAKPPVCIRGHMHDSLFYSFNDRIVICVPSLYNNPAGKPLGAWDITLYFNSQSKIDNIELQSLVVEPKIVPGTKIFHKVKQDPFGGIYL